MPNLFSIECETCHARLSVKDDSAIGQILACPKCGSMVQVQPPPGWRPPVSSSSSRSSNGISRSSDALTGDAVTKVSDASAFEDIDQLLDQKPAVPGKPKQRPRRDVEETRAVEKPPIADSSETRWKGTEKVPAGPANTRPSNGDDGPIVPGGEWTSAQAKARQRMLLVYGGSGLAIILGAVLLIALVAQMFGGDNTSTVTKRDNIPVETEKTDSGLKTEDRKSGTGKNETSEAVNDSKASVDVKKKVDPERNVETADPNTSLVDDNDPELPRIAPLTPTDETEDMPPGFVEPRKKETETGGEGVGEGAVADLMRLSEFLEGSAFDKAIEGSAPELGLGGEFSRDLAYIEKPQPMGRMDAMRNMGNEIGVIKFSDKTISEVVAFVESMTSVPVTIDSESLAKSGARMTDKVSLHLASTSPLKVLEEVFLPRGLTVEPGEHGVVVAVKPDDTVSSREYDISSLIPQESDVEHEEIMVKIVELFVAPESWSLSGGTATIEASDGKLTVSQSAENHARIESLLSKITAATKLPSDKAAAPVKRHTAAVKGLDQPTKVEFIKPRFLRDLITRLAVEHEITLLIDWESLNAQGWNVKTEIPFGAPDSSLYESFDAILRSMKLSMVGYDSNLYVITTPEKAAASLSTEIYLLGDIVTDKVAAEKVAGQIQRIVAGELAANRNACYFVAKADQYYLLARVSQDRQIKIDAFLKSIKASLAVSEK